MAATQKDIARETGVSQSVVSDVLHDRPRGRVSPETRRRILQAAKELGYRPNASARALRLRRSGQIAYVTTVAEADRFNALADSTIPSLARTLAGREYRLILEVTESRSHELERIREMFATGACDACVVRVYEESDETWSGLRRVTGPVVVIGQCPDLALTSVAHDVPGMVATAVGKLAAEGHRRLGLLSGSRRGRYSDLIHSAWRKEIGRHGGDPERWVAVAPGRLPAREQALAWLAEPEGPTALLCLEQRVLLGVSDALLRRRITLGQGFDVAMIGHRDWEWLCPPGTWFIGTDGTAIGQQVAEELAHLLEGGAHRGPVRLLPDIIRTGGSG